MDGFDEYFVPQLGRWCTRVDRRLVRWRGHSDRRRTGADGSIGLRAGQAWLVPQLAVARHRTPLVFDSLSERSGNLDNAALSDVLPCASTACGMRIAVWHLVHTTRTESARRRGGVEPPCSGIRGPHNRSASNWTQAQPACPAGGCGCGASLWQTGCTLALQRHQALLPGPRGPGAASRRVVYIVAEVVISEKRVKLSSLASSANVYFIHSSMFTCFSNLLERIDQARRTRLANASSPTASNPARSAVMSDCRDHAINGISIAPSISFDGLIAFSVTVGEQTAVHTHIARQKTRPLFSTERALRRSVPSPAPGMKSSFSHSGSS